VQSLSEKAGMTRICEQPPSKEALNIAEVLSNLGFNLQFLSSHSHVLSILAKLKTLEITQIKRAFIKNQTPRFLKYFNQHQPYGKVPEYIRKVEEVDRERLAGLIKVAGFLLQTKIYLFWRSNPAMQD
jgi:hypothetical protein